MVNGNDERSRPTPSPFGQLLRRLRALADLTQEELAERAGVSARLVSDLERGTIQRPRRSTVEMLADGLELDGDDRARFADTARPKHGQTAGDEKPLAHAALASDTLVGREREVAAITGLLHQPATRMLTLTGPGGVGKTSLANETATRAAAAFPDGVVTVDLAPVAGAARVVPAIAAALKLHDRGDAPLLEQLLDALRDMYLLLVLDNLEHLTDAAPDIGRMLDACPRLTVLGTSRRPLRLKAEREYPVVPLGLPDLSDLPALEELRVVPAVELFVRRAEAARPSFALTGANAADVAAIVARLDGLPLAIELAAARIRLLAPADLLARLELRLPLLTGGHDAPARQQTMRAAIGWSYDLLDEREQALYRRLAVFSGGFSLEAAEEICAPDDGHTVATRVDVLDIITALIDHSLLRLLEPPGGALDAAPRFGMLETIREHGAERLAAAGEEDDARQRHAAWVLAFAERALPELSGPDQRAWYERLETEHDNIRAAMRWAIDRGEAELALRLAGALYRFWVNCDHLVEGRDWVEGALAVEGATDFPAARAEALLGAGVFAWFLGDYDGAEARTEAALAGFHELGDLAGVASSLGNLGMIADTREAYPRARALYEEALGLFRVLNDQTRTGYMLSNLGLIAYFEGDYARAVALDEEALAIFRDHGDDESIAILLGNLGLVAFAQQDYQRAAALQGEALGLRLSRNRTGIARILESFALIAIATGDHARGMRLFGAAEALRARVGAALPPNDAELYDGYIAAARAELGEEAFTEAWADGASMSFDATVEYAREGIPASTATLRHHR